MAWVFIVLAGLALGMVFRVAAVMALGAVLFVAAIALDLHQGAGWGGALVSAFLKLVVLQAAYLAGLLLHRLLHPPAA
ncbi:hypothetical protein ACLBXM_18380 [Xanthobacteraceae bacterium A53D]